MHGSGTGSDLFHLEVGEGAVEDLEVVEQGVLHDGISGERRVGYSGDFQLTYELGQIDVSGLRASQLPVYVEADGAILLGAGDVVPFPDLEAGP